MSQPSPARPVADPGPTPDAVIPAYGAGALSDLLPSIAARLGVDGYDRALLEVPASDRYVIVLVDGLGWAQIRQASRHAPYLASLLAGAGPITAGVPSTTATSLTSLGTGLPPGQHGMVGYTCRVPETGEILNLLTWESDLLPEAFQPHPTCFERMASAGIAVSSVSLERFAGTGLTEAGLRGPEFVGFRDEADEDRRIALTVEAASRGWRSVVYSYERQLDHVGHVSGCVSPDWLANLRRIDALCARLRDELPSDVRLLITGDHGMVDVPPAHQIVAEDDPDLMAGLSALAGEGRFRQLYVDDEPAAGVADRWRDRLGGRAWVRTRDEAIDAGWFGPVTDDVRGRYGDVLVAMRGDWAVMSRQWPREFNLIGMHGSLTTAEMTVPLLWD